MLAYLSEVSHKKAFIEVSNALSLTSKNQYGITSNHKLETVLSKFLKLQRAYLDWMPEGETKQNLLDQLKEIDELMKTKELTPDQLAVYKEMVESNNNNNHT